MICTVVGAMPERDLFLPEKSFLIAADKGLEQLHSRGITPDLTVGDFDSLGFVPEGTAVVRHPVRKDDTDMLLAVREGLNRGYRRFLLYGGVGGRLDHTLANIQTLSFLAEHGAKGLLYGDGTAVMLLENETVRLPKRGSGSVSVFAFGGTADGVCIRGLSYTLEHGTLTDAFPLGVSNAFCGNEAEIAVRNGKMLLVWQTGSKDAVSVIDEGCC